MKDLAAQEWSFRAGAEREAALRFERLADQLAATGADSTVVRMARQAARDELDHADRCAGLALHFGGQPPGGDPSAPREASPPGLPARARVLYEVVAMSCVTETLSAALLSEMATRASDPLVRSTVRAILKDEVEHSRLGWAHLAAEHAHGVGSFLSDHLPAILAGTVTEELFAPVEGTPAPGAAKLGALERADRLFIFTATMRDVVFPGLERFGVDTSGGARWLAARTAVSGQTRQ